MAKIILSQNIDKPTDYRDIPFQLYHFPNSYINQIHEGDEFIYYQGDRYKREHRYYFGTGVIGNIRPDETGRGHYCDIVGPIRFPQVVPIYTNDPLYIESIQYIEVRKRPTPPWQSSIRPISRVAFATILQIAGLHSSANSDTLSVELPDPTNPLGALRRLNEKYALAKPSSRHGILRDHIDRGANVTRQLKKILGAVCQICGTKGFTKKDGENYIEAHHISQLAAQTEGALCTDNILLVCANCHREIHYGRDFKARLIGDWIEVSTSIGRVKIRQNTLEHLETLVVRQLP